MSKTTIFQSRLRDFSPADGGGLNLTVKSGRVRDDNTVTDKADQTVALTDDTTNYVEIDTLGVATHNTSSFTSGSIAIATVVTASGTISTITDQRTWIAPRGNLDVGARAYHSVSISVPHNSVTTLSMDSELWDTDTMHDTVTNNSRITAKTKGKYTLSTDITFANNTTGGRAVLMRINGSTVIMRQDTLAIGGIIDMSMNMSTEYELDVNDFVLVQAFQTSGGALDVTKIQVAAQLIARS
jgi:hypothetical protein